jgi:hypothetical protein
VLGKDFPQALIENPVFDDLEKGFESHEFDFIAGAVNGLLQLNPIPQWVLDRVTGSSLLREKLARHETTSVHYLEFLSTDSEDIVRCSVASAINILNMSPNYIATLAQDSNVEVRIKLAENTGIPVSCFETLARDNEIEVRCAIARNSNAPAHCLEILAKDIETEVLLLAAQHRNTSSSCLESIFQKASKNNEILAGLASNQSSSTNLLLTIYSHFNSSIEIRRCLACNITTPKFLLETLSYDVNSGIRYCIVNNPSTSDAVKNNLLKDIDENVSFAALNIRYI